MHMLKKMRIGKRLIVSFIIITIITSISGIVGLIILNSMNLQYSSALVVNGFVQGDLGKFNTALNRGTALIRDMIFLSDEEELQVTKGELEELYNKTNQAFADMKVNCTTPAELEQIQIIAENLPKYQEIREQVIDLGLQNKNEEALDLFREQARPYLNKCVDAVETLIDMNVKMGNEVKAKLSGQAILSSIIIVIVILGSISISCFIGIWIAKSISNPLKACVERFGLLEKGDLHSAVPVVDSKDEIAEMLNSMGTTVNAIQTINEDIDICLDKLANGNLDVTTTGEYQGDFTAIKHSIDKIVESLNRTMYEINESAEQVANGAGQVSEGAQTLAEGAMDQSSSIEELSATMNEVSDQVSKTAEQAQNANQKTQASSNEVLDCNNQMKEMMNAMNSIQQISHEISTIINNIEDIATQTNLLSLNAAIEAARAGDAGKGFAVVAEQVSQLAGESAKAVQNTAQLIERNLAAVENGIHIAGNTASAMNSVVGSTREVGEIVDGISSSAKTQAESINQIMVAINQIADIIQSNSATSQESSAASEELLAQAQTLKGLVEQFQIKKA